MTVSADTPIAKPDISGERRYSTASLNSRELVSAIQPWILGGLALVGLWHLLNHHHNDNNHRRPPRCR